jgi:DNA-directed RNA polymerase sigma subunit (sigma70/sigma32)
MITEQKRKELSENLSKISIGAKEKTVYRTKYGLDDGIFKSNEETGKIFNMTGEAVRQILAKVDELMKS